MKNDHPARHSKPELGRKAFEGEFESKSGKKLRNKVAEAVREHDRKKNDSTGRVHHNGPGK